MAAYLKTVTMKVDLRLDDHTNRVIAALDANKGVLLPAINQLMGEAWAEGFADGERQDAEGDDGPRFTNPYLKGDKQ